MLECFVLMAMAAAGPDLRIEAGRAVARLPAAIAATLPEGKVPNAAAEPILKLALLPANGSVLFGSYERKGNVLTFRPRFALAAGERYRATLVLGRESMTRDHLVPAQMAQPAAEVAAVFPSADELPANTLKFYLHFSKPMREGPAIFERIHLLDSDGNAIEDPWRRTELWNEDATRLTLWIHPGRIKEGVNLREDLGPVLQPNRKYSLVVDKSLTDARGEPLGAALKKSFCTTAAVRTAIDVRDWTIASPKAGTREPLKVVFPRPWDRALLGRCLTLSTTGGNVIEGVVEIGPKELSWSFTPTKPWSAGKITLATDEKLEDLAGNSILRPFDLDLKAPPMKSLPRTLSITVAE